MECKEYTKILSAFVDEELNPAEEEMLMAHLEMCEKCREELSQLYLMKQMCHEMKTPELPDSFHKELMSKIEREERKQVTRFKSWKWQYSGAMAAVFALVFLGVTRVGSFEKQPIENGILTAETSPDVSGGLSLSRAQSLTGERAAALEESTVLEGRKIQEAAEEGVSWKVTVEEADAFASQLKTYLKEQQISYEESGAEVICYNVKQSETLKIWIKAHAVSLQENQNSEESNIKVLIKQADDR